MVVARYKGTQQQFYTVSKKIAASLQARLANFTLFSPEYDQPYVDALIQQIIDAEKMPDEQTRDEKTETQRALLVEETKKGLNNWQDLKRYAKKNVESSRHSKIQVRSRRQQVLRKGSRIRLGSRRKSFHKQRSVH